MGQRANLIVIEGGRQSMYYTHWRANTLDTDLFWGPEHATNFIRAQREVDQETGWLDDVWAEGGAVVDHDRKVLLMFGGEDMEFDVPLRRTYLEMARCVWKGWEIRWAHEGIADMADTVGYPRDKILSKEHDRHLPLMTPEQKQWIDTAASVRFADGRLLFYPLPGYTQEYLLYGPDLLKEIERVEGYTALPLDEWLDDSFPLGGFCVDIERRELAYWVGDEIAGVPGEIDRIWAGWTVEWWRDDFEFQLKNGQGLLRFPDRSEKVLRERIVRQLLGDHSTSSVDLLMKSIERAQKEGKKVEVNSWALRDDQLEVPIEVRREIVAAVLAKLAQIDAKES